METETEKILNTLRTFLESKDRQIEYLKLLINELRQNVKTSENDDAKHSDIQTNDLGRNLFICDIECCQCSCHKVLSSDIYTQTFETDFHNTDFTNSALDWTPDEGTNVTVTELITEAANDNVSQNDYVYDETSKMYYSPSTGYYYDWERSLLYDPYSKTYYKYDNNKNSYEFCYQFDTPNDASSQDCTEQVSEKVSALKLDEVSPTYNNDSTNQVYRDSKKKKKNKGKAEKRTKNVKSSSKSKVKKKFPDTPDDVIQLDSCSSLEEGEIESSSDCADLSSDDEPAVDNQFVPEINEDSSDGWPPCIRAIIRESSHQKIGSLFLIPCTGGVIGRDKSNSIYIPDISISRVHAKVSFDKGTWSYSISDLGSQNGTFINDIRVGQDSSESCQSLKHGDILALGFCKLLIHIHQGSSTCNECEPGLVQAEQAANEEKSSTIKSKEEREKERRQQLKQIKKKFGLENTSYVDGEKAFSSKSQSYQNRAETRRKVVGSQNPYEKDTPPSTLDTSVPPSNKGYQMLKKMGWQDGESVGMNDSGIKTPVEIQYRNTRAGLGSDPVEQVSIPEDPRRRKWKKAQKRFQDLYETVDEN